MRLFEGTQWDVPPTCDRCNQTEEKCDCAPLPKAKGPAVEPGRQKLRLKKEKRKKGKVVTLVTGFQLGDEQQLEEMLRKLKNECGAGGKIDDQAIEIQGDQLEKLEKILSAKGFPVRVIGAK